MRPQDCIRGAEEGEKGGVQGGVRKVRKSLQGVSGIGRKPNLKKLVVKSSTD
jgi:hypothetical protein